MWETLRRATVAEELVVDRMDMLGPRVAVTKTEAIIFGGPGWRVPRNAVLPIAGEAVQIKSRTTLDRKWNDGKLFSRLAPKLVGTASAVGRLVPNGGGPKGACRRIYAGMARSMELYGSPIWANRLSEQNKALL